MPKWICTLFHLQDGRTCDIGPILPLFACDAIPELFIHVRYDRQEVVTYIRRKLGIGSPDCRAVKGVLKKQFARKY